MNPPVQPLDQCVSPARRDAVVLKKHNPNPSRLLLHINPQYRNLQCVDEVTHPTECSHLYGSVRDDRNTKHPKIIAGIKENKAYARQVWLQRCVRTGNFDLLHHSGITSWANRNATYPAYLNKLRISSKRLRAASVRSITLSLSRPSMLRLASFIFLSWSSSIFSSKLSLMM